MLRSGHIRYHLADILAAHWWDFVRQYRGWIRPVVFKNVRKVLACRTAALGCHVYQCPGCGDVRIVPHSCKSRFCPTCGKQATDRWAARALDDLLPVPYHHLVLAIPWQLRVLIGMNRQAGLNLLFAAATEAVQQWARDVKQMRMGMVLVAHTFGADLKWHPHIHLVVTGGGLSLDGKRWIATEPNFLMSHSGLKKRWKYQVLHRLRALHRAGVEWRFPARAAFLKDYGCFSAMLNKLWSLIWYAHLGTALLDPRFSVRYIGRYTKRAVLAEYRITNYDGRIVQYLYKDYADGGRTRYAVLPVAGFIGRLIRHIPEEHFPMIRHCGLFCNRWKQRYLAQAAAALGQPPPLPPAPTPTWRERQTERSGRDPLQCPRCGLLMVLAGVLLGPWATVQETLTRLGLPADIPAALGPRPVPPPPPPPPPAPRQRRRGARQRVSGSPVATGATAQGP